MDAWEVLRALEDLLCDFGWVGGRQVNKWSRAKGSREKGKNQADFQYFRNRQTCCNWDPKKGEYVYPAKKHLQQYRVLITTLITASR